VYDGNEMVFCDGLAPGGGGKLCGVAVHQRCYGIAEVCAAMDALMLNRHAAW
jgi:hypothetical protein